MQQQYGCFLSWAIIVASCIIATVNGAESSERQLHVGVERSLPVVGEPCRLWVEWSGSAPAEASEERIVQVHFFVAYHGGVPVVISRGSEALASPAVQLTTEWVPTQLGKCRVTATVVVQDSAGVSRKHHSKPVDAFVTTRKLHFNYWQCIRKQKFVTSVLDNSESIDSPDQWRRRGVTSLEWKGGRWLWDNGFDSVDKVLADWNRLPKNKLLGDRGGWLIDEFGGGDHVDQQLGIALELARKGKPKLFLAPYCLAVRGEAMIKGLRQSDLVLIETYTSDWRGDGMILDRWRSAEEAGLVERSIAVLGMGSRWTSTERELRRVVRMLRTECPEMPGIGFFPGVPSRLAANVDHIIEEYFLRPVITAEVDDGQVVVRNIGETTAQRVELSFLSARRKGQGTRVIHQIEPWTKVTQPLPSGASDVVVAPGGNRYTALDFVAPLKLPPPDSQAIMAARRYWRVATNGRSEINLRASDGKGERSLRVLRTDSKHDNPNFHNNVDSAHMPLRVKPGSAITLTFDLRLGKSWFYAQNGVSLGGEGTLALKWAHNDNDAGLNGDEPRPTLSFKGKDGYVVRDVPGMGFKPDQLYHVMLAYDGEESVRAIVKDAADTLLWDSGSLPAKGGLVCTELRFEVSPFLRSDIRYDLDRGEIFLRGVKGGGSAPSPYVLESSLSNMRLFVESHP